MLASAVRPRSAVSRTAPRGAPMPTNRCGSMGGPRVRSAADAIPLKAWLIPRRVLFLANCLCLACVALVAYGAKTTGVDTEGYNSVSNTMSQAGSRPRLKIALVSGWS